MPYPKKLYLHGDTNLSSVTVWDEMQERTVVLSGFYNDYRESPGNHFSPANVIYEPDETPKRRGRPPKVP